MNATLRNPEIRLFDTLNAVTLIAAANGVKCQLSDKGVYQRDSLEKFGGISEAGKILHDRASWAVLNKFLDHEKREKGTYDEGCVLQDKRTYLDLTAARKAMGGDETAAVTLLDNLSAAKILYRGFVLGCAVCRHAEWYSLAELTDEFRCRRCGRQQIIRREHWRHPASPQIFYKLDEIVYQFLTNNGNVVALSLDYLSRSSKYPFSYSPEIEFSTGSKFAETDFCAVWDGVLTLGEAKKQGNLDPSDSLDKPQQVIIDNYVHLAKMLHARRVLFCTTARKWKNSTREAVCRAFAGELAVPRFLSADELLAAPQNR